MIRPPKALPAAYYKVKRRRKLAEKFLCSMLTSNIGIASGHHKKLTKVCLELADEMIKQTK